MTATPPVPDKRPATGRRAAKRPATRRIGGENSATRVAILDTTERLMVAEGYAAVTSRRVAAEAGLTAPLIHYYFPTTDDLFLAVYRRCAERAYARLEQALAAERPLHALWTYASDDSVTPMAVELMALANHRKVLRGELTRFTERTRERQTEAMAKLLAAAGGELQSIPPLVLTLFMVGVARTLVLEAGVGIALGHAEVRACIERWLDDVEPL